MTTVVEDYLAHYGILRRSGRYPWGSGGNASQQDIYRDFLAFIEGLRNKGMSEVDIAKSLDITTTQLRAAKTIAKNEKKAADIALAQRLKDKGYSNGAIAERMGLAGESSVRSLLAAGQQKKQDILQNTADMLQAQVDSKKYIDVGVGVERHIGVTRTRFDAAVAMLREKGYTLHYIKMEQLGTGMETTIKVLAGPDVHTRDVYKNKFEIASVTDFSTDGGESFKSIQPPLSIDSKRLAIRYAEQGGTDSDGVVFIRPGVEDVSLGGVGYAQVRVAVDGTHYIKGMAVYKDDLPKGVDLMFNTNKSDTGNKLDALKPLQRKADGEIDEDNPFGSAIKKQLIVKDKDGKDRVTSAMNIVNEEGDWENWSKNIASQVLSKQNSSLAKQQLDITFNNKKQEFDEIMSLTNPTVRQKLLESFADDCDSSAVHLKAAAMPRQTTQVLIPINSMKTSEVYAPNFNNGETVVLIRYPHGGIFEIPELRVNNRNAEAKKILGNAKDAIGINAKVAEKLSGADFDGDTVLIIPNNDRQFKSAPSLEGLKNFDPKVSYPAYEGMPKMSAKTKGYQMGDITNLITDMSIKGAKMDEIARAVRHSMVVIDAEKHNLNYKQSALDNGIAQLKQKYQGGAKAGAATLISKATSEARVPVRKERSAKEGGFIDKKTGKKVWVETGETYPVTNKKGEVTLVPKTQKSTKLAETDDAHTLSSGSTIEKVYADHSNRLKALANQARKEQVNTKPRPQSASAKTAYAKEVDSLNAKLNIALKNAPLERQAQVVANSIVAAKKKDYPDMDAAQLKKIKAQALETARVRTGAKKQRIDLTDNEWAAIQAGAISTNKLSQILMNTDLDKIKKLATPKAQTLMTSAKTQQAKGMLARGYTQAEVAAAIGVSLTTLKNSIGGG